MNALELTQKLVRKALQLPPNEPLPPETPLMGGFAEFNSLTIMTLMMDIEAQLGCELSDDELSGELFETVGTLAAFVEEKMATV